MYLSRAKKILLGVLTIWPVIYIGLFFAFIFTAFILASNKHTSAGDPKGIVITLVGLHFFTMFVIMSLVVFYVVHVVKANFKKSEMKIIWLILVLMGGPIAMPVYWYMNIWREMQTVAPETPPASSDAT